MTNQQAQKAISVKLQVAADVNGRELLAASELFTNHLYDFLDLLSLYFESYLRIALNNCSIKMS
ncbi:MAG TPA: hypothetical protein VKR52_07640 [Terracidiphilus sp.]|nr:hypothetical protein [Terracidiphilus sp.]